MHKLLPGSIVNKTFSTGKIFIRNSELPICAQCVHFVEDTSNYPYDPPPKSTDYGKCKKFGEVDLITGSLEYDFAKICRLNVEKCGPMGKEYKYNYTPSDI
jgi:hypothetical protein